MKSALCVALGCVAAVSAHYEFQSISVAGKAYGKWEGVRQHVNMNSPVTDLASKDLICNKGAISGANTVVLDAIAGDEITFFTDVAVYHQGPVSLFLSKSVGPVQDSDGSFGWQKVYDWGPTFTGNGQASWPMYSKYSYKLPTCIPNGEYLVRIQSLGIHNPYPAGIPQFYISCAQLNVSGGTGTSLTWAQPIQIPGAFKATDSGYTANIYNPGMTTYEVPGGPVWAGC